MAFSKKRVEERKDWMNQHEDGTFLDNSVEEVSYPGFVNKELVLFSKADLERSASLTQVCQAAGGPVASSAGRGRASARQSENLCLCPSSSR